MSEGQGSPAHSSGFVIRNQTDVVGGLCLVAIALFAIWASADLPGMRGFQFGPGTAPRMFSILLALIGALIAGMGVVGDGPKLPFLAWRGPVLLTASIVLFAVMIRPLGLVISSFVMFVFAASGSREVRWVEAVVVGAFLTLFCTLLFVYLLNLPFQMWPRFTVFGVTIAF